jgi:8-oxo-dGTP pyrophosphatase MutT (NUDIX family)
VEDERFAIPGVAGIIIKKENDNTYVLIQQRCKQENNYKEGIFEIPSGKVREFESVYDCLKREVKEETGLIVDYIEGQDQISVLEVDDYKVINYNPFACAQNIKKGYPIIVQVFICHAHGRLLEKSDESKDIHWINIKDLEKMLQTEQNAFYPMHIDTLKRLIKEYD